MELLHTGLFQNPDFKIAALALASSQERSIVLASSERENVRFDFVGSKDPDTFLIYNIIRGYDKEVLLSPVSFSSLHPKNERLADILMNTLKISLTQLVEKLKKSAFGSDEKFFYMPIELSYIVRQHALQKEIEMSHETNIFRRLGLSESATPELDTETGMTINAVISAAERLCSQKHPCLDPFETEKRRILMKSVIDYGEQTRSENRTDMLCFRYEYTKLLDDTIRFFRAHFKGEQSIFERFEAAVREIVLTPAFPAPELILARLHSYRVLFS